MYVLGCVCLGVCVGVFEFVCLGAHVFGVCPWVCVFVSVGMIVWVCLFG